MEHDIGNLVGLETRGIVEGTIDLITCAAAFVLVENPGAAVKNWAKLLKKGGKLICRHLYGDNWRLGIGIAIFKHILIRLTPFLRLC